MGGCRCTYKNCSLRTDGVTHMFHYPVFDKVRCHQWLTNAQKLEFLDLKVSQLKNRVVCQHHFKDDYFMNFKKDKLKFDAVPTLDGPYCDTRQFPEKRSMKYESKHYNIAVEDIENDEYLTCNDKKANFSVKYADFLTNGELLDLDINEQTDNRQLIKLDSSHQFNENNTILYDNIAERKIINQSLNNSFDSEQRVKNVFTIELTEVPIEEQNNLPISETVKKEIDVKSKENRQEKRKSLLKDKKVIILDEQSISNKFPTNVPLKLEKVSPSAIITLPNKKGNRSYLLENSKNKSNSPHRTQIKDVIMLAEQKKNFEIVDNPEVDNEVIDVNLDRTNMEQVNIIISQNSNNVINTSNFMTTNNVINSSSVIQTSNIINSGNSINTGNFINNGDVINTSNIINSGNSINIGNFINNGDVINTSNIISTNNVNNSSKIIHTNSVINTNTAINTNNVINSDNAVNTSSITNANTIFFNNTRSVINNSKNANNLNTVSVLNSNSVLNNNNNFINRSNNNTNDDINIRSFSGANKKNNSLLKNKIPPERIAAIQEKRKFNMKLRDIIADCLDKIDDNESNNYNNNKSQTKQEQLSQKVNYHLAKAPELPNIQEYTVAYLEARMNRMEKILLKKIDNNSQRILDLKNSLASSISKNTISTKTILNEEERKKQLFKEISQYLSTEANSLIYEELFIDKYVSKKPKYSPRKKRK